ncbi:MAG: hypothetical protein MJZ09_07785 [Bacteroidales bacterium]|nr:hypothetical protein [Bacteroidales bacterium]
MNKIFSFDRFSKYFVYDLNNAKNNYGLSLLIQGCLPIVIFVFSNFFSLVFSQEYTVMNKPLAICAFGVALFTVMLTAPNKLYGGLTDKKMGSDWILIPASTFEKFLSMMVIVCVIIPLVLVVLLAGSDFLLSLFFKEYQPAVVWISDIVKECSTFFKEFDGPMFTNAVYGAFWLNWVEVILAFTLGTICFKKAKVGKTILVLWLLSCVLSLGVVSLFGIDVDMENIIKNITPEKAEFWINFVINMIYLVVIGGLMAGIYFRLKTIKH